MKSKYLQYKKSVILEGDSLSILKTLPDESVQCVVTSPPYWGLRDYEISGQIGLEKNLQCFLFKLKDVFSEVKRVLKSDGILWINIGDGYTSGNRKTTIPDPMNPQRGLTKRPATPDGLKPKDLIGIPWRLAFILQDDGWYLRTDVIWNKPNPMPESVKDRPTRSHEYLFMFTKSERYFYDHLSILEENGRNKRTIWDVPTRGYKGLHFATFPPKLIEPCILSSTKNGDFVLDPFFGSGTTGVVASENNRNYIGIELNSEYVQIASERLRIIQKRFVFE